MKNVKVKCKKLMFYSCDGIFFTFDALKVTSAGSLMFYDGGHYICALTICFRDLRYSSEYGTYYSEVK